MKADINKKEAINFNNLVETIQRINTEFSIQAKTAVLGVKSSNDN